MSRYFWKLRSIIRLNTLASWSSLRSLGAFFCRAMASQLVQKQSQRKIGLSRNFWVNFKCNFHTNSHQLWGQKCIQLSDCAVIGQHNIHCFFFQTIFFFLMKIKIVFSATNIGNNKHLPIHHPVASVLSRA